MESLADAKADTGRAGRALRGFAAGLLAGSVCGVILSVPYAYYQVHMPLVVLSLPAPICLGLLIGLAASCSARLVSGSSPRAVVAAATCAAAVALYFAWVVWIYAYEGAVGGRPVLILSPGELWAAIARLGLRGAWYMGSITERADEPMRGGPLGVVWFGEAFLVAAVTWGTALMQARIDRSGEQRPPDVF